LVKIATIVEGHGEVEAVPILIRRIVAEVAAGTVTDLARPIRVPRGRLLRVRELERAVELAARQVGSDGCILIVLDADDDCPRELAPEILSRARGARPDRQIRVVLPKAEYESWFLAAASSLAGLRGIRSDVVAPTAPEEIRDAKAWLTQHMSVGRSYHETVDQPALSARFDLASARAAPSFEKLWRDLESLLA
jgi:hypothetical protein